MQRILMRENNVLNLQDTCLRAMLPKKIDQLLTDVFDRSMGGVENDLLHGLKVFLCCSMRRMRMKQTRITSR